MYAVRRANDIKFDQVIQTLLQVCQKWPELAQAFRDLLFFKLHSKLYPIPCLSKEVTKCLAGKAELRDN